MILLNYVNLKLIQHEDRVEIKCLRVMKKLVDVTTFDVDPGSRFAHLATVEYRGTAISISASFHKNILQNVYMQYTQGTTVKATYFYATGSTPKFISSLVNTYIERSFGGRYGR